MSEQLAANPAASLVADHACLVCEGHASFGYTTRRGVVWTCLAHRDAGEHLLVAPSASARGSATP